MQPSKDRPHSPKRLRSTCDRCTTLKVRCDKKKPYCERCESTQHRCVYGPYRWKGRQPATHDFASKTYGHPTELTKSAKVSKPSPQHTASTAQMSTGLWPVAHPNILSNYALFSEMKALPVELHDEIDDFPAGLGGELGQSISPLPLGMESSSGPDRTPSQETSNYMSSLPGSDTLSVLETSPSLSYMSSPESRTPDVACYCATLAFSTLHDMHHAEFAFRMENNSGLLSRDHIFKMNRTAVQNLNQLLSQHCIVCLSDHSVLFLITAIGSKVLSWYQILFSRISRHPPDARLMHPLGTGSVAPVYFGDLELDGVTEQRITAQFLLCELQSLSKVFELNGEESMGTVLSTTCSFLFSTLNNLASTIDLFCVSKPSVTLA
ncbi:hypothetical protein BDV25DRAFT_129181 [Aspergillus avenaceus]|uniref:Zn(2)-C6 fungal-type domain-containing protein n=1 Tax=Aspergillus avenaceus TaxID=36643 RepID=A0A5N6TX88_ASPAV|nr:hypothetical protein BDV25DRAFT_129181 [Aspergillus avenaceus]